MDTSETKRIESTALYRFELPIGARVTIDGHVLLHQGEGVFVGNDCPLVIPASMTASQLANKALSFNVHRILASGETLSRELYLASGDIHDNHRDAALLGMSTTQNSHIGGFVPEDSLLLTKNKSPRFGDGLGFDSQSPLLVQDPLT